MTLHLATTHTPPLRFTSQGGSLRIDARPATLAEAHRTFLAWWGEARTLEWYGGDPVLSVHLRATAVALESACRECIRQRVAAGWRSPLDADRKGVA